METRIHYYGILTEIVANDNELVNLNSGSSSIELKAELIDKHPAFAEIPLVLFQNQKLCADQTELQPGVEIDCMPPFSGG